MTSQFIVEPADKGKRLDKFLVEKLPEQSRVAIQRDIKAGRWVVEGKSMTPHYALKEGQKVEEVKQIADQRGSSRLVLSRINADVKISIIAETDDYLIVDKPAGIAVHAAPGIHGATLIDLLLPRYPELRKIGGDPSRPGIVHRLDKLVSGVMIIARTPQAFDYFSRAFRERKIEKEYHALVAGTFVNDHGEIALPLTRSTSPRRRGTMTALPHKRRSQTDAETLKISHNAREALTRFEVARRFPRLTFLKVFPKTGRTHQIRVHLAAIGHPIIGDPLYGGKARRQIKTTLNRPFLHASSLTFTDLQGEVKTYHAPLPVELQQVYTLLQRSKS
ncbi:MAG: RluA family pseudouridine synthase [Patescibacteria group bacterium]